MTYRIYLCDNIGKSYIQRRTTIKTAIIGSRKININIDKYLPKDISMIISGGAIGIDRLAEKYADKNGIPKLILLPNYNMYGKLAPLVRNRQIVNNAELVIAFWDGKSRGTKYTIDYANQLGVAVIVHLILI